MIVSWFKKRQAERSKLSHDIRRMSRDIARLKRPYTAPEEIQGYVVGTIHTTSGYETEQVLVTIDGNVHVYSRELGKRSIHLGESELRTLRELQLLMREFLFPSK